MAITLRTQKGSELTFQELDNNFTDLNGRVSTLETSNANDISLTSLSVTTNSASGNGTLTYSDATGVFAYTPPDLSSYLTSVPAQSFASLTGKPTTIAGYGITDAVTSAGLNGAIDTHLNQSTASNNEVLSWNGSDYAWVSQSGAGGVALSDLSVTTASASGTPSLSYNNSSGVFTYTPPDLANAIVANAQYTTTVTTNAADTSDTGAYILGNTGSASATGSSTGWVFADIVQDPDNPGTTTILDVDNALLTGNVVGDITSGGTSQFNGTVDFSNSSSVDFTGASVSGLPNDTWATLGDKNGPSGPSQIALGTDAGNVNQGANSIAIGAQAGVTNQAATSIVINATGIVLDNAIPESFVVKPVRGLVTAQALYYDVATGEVTYGAAGSGGGGTFALAGNTGTHTFNTATETLTFLGTTGQINAGVAANNVTLELDPNINSIVSISFEGTTPDTNETKLQATDPTADRTINLPDATGNLPLLETSNLFTNDFKVEEAYSATPTNKFFEVETGAGNNRIMRSGINMSTFGQSVAPGVDLTSYRSSPADGDAGPELVFRASTAGSSGSVIATIETKVIATASGAETTEVSIHTDNAGTSVTPFKITGNTVYSASLKLGMGVEEKFSTTNGATGVTEFSGVNGHVHYLTAPAGNVTANFTNLNGGSLTAEYATNVTVIVNQGATARIVSAVQIGGVAQTINWQGGSAPTGTSNGIDAFSFTILNDGGTYVVLGQMVDFT